MEAKGRPKIGDKHKRSFKESTYLSLSELECLEKNATLMGLSKSALIREAINLYYMTYALPGAKK